MKVTLCKYAFRGFYLRTEDNQKLNLLCPDDVIYVASLLGWRYTVGDRLIMAQRFLQEKVGQTFFF